ncbi:MAG: IS30 family transposase [Candidatus Delongbacteria bacterium]|nr:IS30 family transposase [Candidatus Delongbacteria bacterium]
MKKKRQYCQLNQYHRKKVDEFLLYEYSLSEIALKLGFDKSTISREIKRNSHNGKYYPVKAHKLTKKRQSEAPKNKKITRSMEDTIKELTEEDWSPEQISAWCKKERLEMLSHEMIYQYIYNDERNGGKLYTHLRHSRKRRKKYGSKRLSNIKNKRRIADRPKIVEDKTRIGDWEIDTVVGAKHEGSILTIVDRVAKFLLSKQFDYNTAENVKVATIELLKPFKDKVQTITSDNGSEFTYHEDIARELECGFYFADPYSSWQRGLNENTNGLLRQYFPKGISLKNIPDEKLQKAVDRINSRPRKTLNYKTPEAIFFGVD